MSRLQVFVYLCDCSKYSRMMTAEGILAENKGIIDLLKRAGFFMEISQLELFAFLDHFCNPDLVLQTRPNTKQLLG